LLKACSQANDLTGANRLLEDPTFDINAQNARRKSVAHLVLGTANVTTNKSKMIRIATAIQFLCQQNADLTVADDSGSTPLHCCVKTANTMAAQYLIDHHVHVNPVDNNGNTPLYLLAIDSSPVLDMATVLLRAGAHLNAKRLPELSGKPSQARHILRSWLRNVS
jgi:ankyrin repeat protein